MPGARHRPVVRLLTRRTGVQRRREPLQPLPLLEVAEVFRIDVVGQLFEGRQPVLQVTYHFSQDPAPELQLREQYPLELPDIVDDTRRYARLIFQSVFEGDFEAMEFLRLSWSDEHSPIHDVWRIFGQPHGRPWRDMPPDCFFHSFHLLGLNQSMIELPEEEIEMLVLTVQHLVDEHPEEVIALGPFITDIVQVMLVFAWSNQPGNRPHPLI